MGNPSKTGGRVTAKKPGTKAKKAATSASEWKKSGGEGLGNVTELEVPSGKVCLMRIVGMEAFVTAGLIPNSLMPIVRKAIGGGGEFDMNEDDVTEEQMVDMMRLFDSVTCYVVVQPKVHMNPGIDEVRDDDKLYADEVDLQDKMFIFNVAVGGTKDLERFRHEQASMLESVRSVSGDEGETE